MVRATGRLTTTVRMRVPADRTMRVVRVIAGSVDPGAAAAGVAAVRGGATMRGTAIGANFATGSVSAGISAVFACGKSAPSTTA